MRGECSKLDVLGKVADITNGSIKRVNHETIEKDFENFLND